MVLKTFVIQVYPNLNEDQHGRIQTDSITEQLFIFLNKIYHRIVLVSVFHFRRITAESLERRMRNIPSPAVSHYYKFYFKIFSYIYLWYLKMLL